MTDAIPGPRFVLSSAILLFSFLILLIILSVREGDTPLAPVPGCPAPPPASAGKCVQICPGHDNEQKAFTAVLSNLYKESLNFRPVAVFLD